jgi:hypothetical protein
MLMTQESERQARQTEVVKAKQNEGYGAVPNVTEDEAEKKTGEEEEEVELKKALHEFEEEKGDWSKSRG